MEMALTILLWALVFWLLIYPVLLGLIALFFAILDWAFSKP